MKFPWGVVVVALILTIAFPLIHEQLQAGALRGAINGALAGFGCMLCWQLGRNSR